MFFFVDSAGAAYIEDDSHFCDSFCSGGMCCHWNGTCRCGIYTGQYECVCNSGYFGFGVKPSGCNGKFYTVFNII